MTTRTRHPRRRRSSHGLSEELMLVVGRDNVLTSPLDLRLYSRDASLMVDGAPSVVCFPATTAEVQGCVQAARRHGRSIVTRGSGTGLAGGTVPRGPDVVIVTTRLNRIIDIDAVERIAWVEPGVLNADLSAAVAHAGLHFAPDPSSQIACTIGGNVATNAGGAHCLKYGVTSDHVLAIEVVLPDGSMAMLGGLEPEVRGYDLRGAFVGSEGTMGIATRVAVRLTPVPPAVRTLLLAFETIDEAADAVERVLASGIVPAALEMMDAPMVRAIEACRPAGMPTDAAAVLILELDGLESDVDIASDLIEVLVGRNRIVRVARTSEERAEIWLARKSAGGALAHLAPNHYLNDCVVPRSRVADVLRRASVIAASHDLQLVNVFHAGDGNLHPILVFDLREPGVIDRVVAAGQQILLACLDAGGVLSGEHGIGSEKRDYMSLMFSDIDLEVQRCIKDAFDPDGTCNPGKVLPEGTRCREASSASAVR